MVTWRSARLVILVIFFMAMILVFGVAQILNVSPRTLAAAITARSGLFTASAPVTTPTSPSSLGPGVPLAAPRYPAVKITVPATSPFSAETPAANPEAPVTPGQIFSGGGNCIMNDGSLVSLLPNCVVSDDGQVRPSQE